MIKQGQILSTTMNNLYIYLQSNEYISRTRIYKGMKCSLNCAKNCLLHLMKNNMVERYYGKVGKYLVGKNEKVFKLTDYGKKVIQSYINY